MKQITMGAILLAVLACAMATTTSAADIVHDAEYYVLEIQNGERWAAEDEALDNRLAELREKYGVRKLRIRSKPNSLAHPMAMSE